MGKKKEKIKPIEAEVVDYLKKTATLFEEYSEVHKYTENLEKETEEIVKTNKTPNPKITKEVSNTKLAVDLALTVLARQTGVKLLKLEKFLSKIEDRLFNDDVIQNLSNSDLINLYAQTRMLKANSLEILQKIEKQVDFTEVEATIMSLNHKMEDEDSEKFTDINDILQQILSDPKIIEYQKKKQKGNLDNE